MNKANAHEDREALIAQVTALLQIVDPDDFFTIVLSNMAAVAPSQSAFRGRIPRLQFEQQVGGKYKKTHLHAYAIRLVDFVLDDQVPVVSAFRESLQTIESLDQ